MLELTLTDHLGMLKTQTMGNTRKIWDPVRKRWVAMQPEELVRQLTLAFLISEKRYPTGRIAVEKILRGHHLSKRCDILVYSAQGSPFLLVECKAPQIPISLQVFLQAANYNLALQVPYLMMTNGRDTYCCCLDYPQQKIAELQEIPPYPPDK